MRHDFLNAFARFSQCFRSIISMLSLNYSPCFYPIVLMFLIEYKVVIMEIVSTLFICCLCCSFVVYGVVSLYVNTHSFIFCLGAKRKNNAIDVSIRKIFLIFAMIITLNNFMLYDFFIVCSIPY